MGGQIEYARMRMWGTNLGHGLTGLYGDSPRADGTSITVGYGWFGYPRDPGFDRVSTFLSPGPPAAANEDLCISRLVTSGYLGIMEYVDVGDHISLLADDGTKVLLERDPSVHHRPAGESWFAGYGGSLKPVIQEHELLPDNWKSGETWSVGFPGTVVPSESTMGAIPYPLIDGAMVFPPDLAGFTVDDESVRPPHHYYDDDGVWVGYEEFDDVRFPGPWKNAVSIGWEPSDDGTPLTIVVRYLGTAEEEGCDCNADCNDGFTCLEGSCVGDEGSGWNVVGEVACTVADDGEFMLTPQHMTTLDTWVKRKEIQGAVLAVARISEGTVEVADVLTYNQKRVEITPVRTRALDVIWTRLEAP